MENKFGHPPLSDKGEFGKAYREFKIKSEGNGMYSFVYPPPGNSETQKEKFNHVFNVEDAQIITE